MSAPPASSSAVKSSSALEFALLCGQLKKTKRTGWVNNDVKQPESLADHMQRVAVLAFLLPTSSDLDRDRCIKMGLVHDLAESIVGDITPHDGVSNEDKAEMEDNAMKKIQTMLDDSDMGTELYTLWREYEDNTTPESKFIKDLDKFEMILQAYEYETDQGKDLSDFFNSTKGKFTTPLVQGWVEELYKKRDKQ